MNKSLLIAVGILMVPLWAQHNERAESMLMPVNDGAERASDKGISSKTLAPDQSYSTEDVNGRLAVSNEVLVKFRDGATTSPRLQHLMVSRNIRERKLGRSGLMHIRSTEMSTRQLMVQLASDPDVLYVEPNYIIKVSATPNDALFASQWALKNSGQTGGLANADVDAVRAWGISTGSRSVVVGVVDTGIDYTHPDLVGNVWSAPSAFTVSFGAGDTIQCPAGSHGYDAVTNTCDPRDQNSHGTHVAGTIGASANNSAGVAGVNWTASLLGLRFMDASGQGTLANAIRAITFAIQLKAAFPTAANVRVLSNSWSGCGYSQALLDVINLANSAGILFVAASGNKGSNLDLVPDYPASYRTPNLISVAATDASDSLASFSSYGPTSVDIGAPGVSVLSTYPNGGYAYMSGTSMAAPHVAGAAALVLSACGLDTAGLRRTLLSSVDVIPKLTGKTTSGGRLNIYRALSSCSSMSFSSATFSLSSSPTSLAMSAGQSVTASIAITPVGGFAGTTTLSIAGLPSGVSATITPSTVAAGGTAVLKLTAASTAGLAVTNITVTAISGAISRSIAIPFSIRATADFALTLTPASVSVRKGAAATLSLKVGAVNGFASTVRLQASGLPYASYAILPSAMPAATTSMRVMTTTSTPPGTYQITLTGTSGGLVHTTRMTLIVTK